ncbi:RNA polymerase sigma factor [Rubripirellula obstinata]|uniref:RNA polymerase sigma factor n=1 Tax=Rubripirellula obstinata TaxID=406547 RepID=A0A5B1CJH8_9BACT|nr:ECF-type sigma factor [Rubripirellula obstinata]KAA1260441.1 RNA polymerase sigma factor [Rubripirellula obstinata]
MSDSSSQSITIWIEQLKSGRSRAATELWDRYFERLKGLAKQKLASSEKRVFDEEDLAISVFQALCEGVENNRFDRLDNRDDLWSLLIAITKHKCVDQIRRQTSDKRGGGRVRGESVFGQPGGAVECFDDLLKEEPTPDLFVSMDEECNRLMAMLDDEVQARIVRQKLAGYRNREIADQLGISLRSVERKLEVIRDLWSLEFDSNE